MMDQLFFWTGGAFAIAILLAVYRGAMLVKGHYAILTTRLIIFAGAIACMPIVMRIWKWGSRSENSVVPATLAGAALIVVIAFMQASTNIKDGDVKRGVVCTALQLAILVTALLVGLVSFQFLTELASISSMGR